MNANELTPVEEHKGLLMKRDDLFTLKDRTGVNGGKLRQCVMLVDKVKDQYKGIATYASIGSPQNAITAGVAKEFGLPCTVFYGGTSSKHLLESQMPRYVMKYGANIIIGAKTGRHNILHKVADDWAKAHNYFVVQYGINIVNYEDVLIKAVANQVENIPDCENLVAVCGSGITSSGILVGLKMFNKKVRNVHLVATAPDRREFIHNIAKKYGADRKIQYHSLFHEKGFNYDHEATAIWDGITLHPNYEAKAMQWMKREKLNTDGTLFWITGAKPKRI